MAVSARPEAAHPRPHERAPLAARLGDALAHRPPPGALLAAALALTLLYAASAGGAVRFPAAARLEVWVAAVALAAVASVLYGGRLRLSAPDAARWGLGLLAAFALWTWLSIGWSIAPDAAWSDFNRTLAYALVAALAIALGTTLPSALRATALGYLAIATLVAAYALGGKAFPWLQVPGLIDLDHTSHIARLRAPLGYWNALALLCALAAPCALAAATDRRLARGGRLLATAALTLLATAAILTYSRAGIAMLALALAGLAALQAERLRALAYAGAGLAGAAPATIVAFARPDLMRDGVPLAERAGGGLLFALALALGVLASVVLAALIYQSGDAPRLGERGRRLAALAPRAALAVAALALVVAMVASGRGPAVVAAPIESFTSVKAERDPDPTRILQTSSGNRWVWWKEAAGAWARSPLTGHGSGSFARLHLRYRRQQLEVREAHSVPLQLLAETGMVGAALALGGLALLGLAALRRLRAMEAGARERGYGLALGVAGLAWGAHMWFDWDWSIPGVTLPLLLFLGVLAARPRPPRAPALLDPAARSPRARGAALAAATAAACLVAVSAALPSLAEDRAGEARVLTAKGRPADLRAAAREAEVAKRLNPLSDEPLLAAATAAERRGRYVSVSRYLAEAVDRQPDSLQAWLGVARLNLLRGDVPAMLEALGVMDRLDPFTTQVAAAVFEGLVPDVPSMSATATGTPLPVAAEQAAAN